MSEKFKHINSSREDYGSGRLLLLLLLAIIALRCGSGDESVVDYGGRDNVSILNGVYGDLNGVDGDGGSLREIADELCRHEGFDPSTVERVIDSLNADLDMDSLSSVGKDSLGAPNVGDVGDTIGFYNNDGADVLQDSSLGDYVREELVPIKKDERGEVEDVTGVNKVEARSDLPPDFNKVVNVVVHGLREFREEEISNYGIFKRLLHEELIGVAIDGAPEFLKWFEADYVKFFKNGGRFYLNGYYLELRNKLEECVASSGVVRDSSEIRAIANLALYLGDRLKDEDGVIYVALDEHFKLVVSGFSKRARKAWGDLLVSDVEFGENGDKCWEDALVLGWHNDARVAVFATKFAAVLIRFIEDFLVSDDPDLMNRVDFYMLNELFDKGVFSDLVMFLGQE